MTLFPKAAFNQSGFLLIQTLVGLGILGILTMAVISFIQFSAASQRRLHAVQAFNDQVSFAQMSLDDIKACTYNLGTVGTGASALEGIQLPPVGGEMSIELKVYNADEPTKPRATARSIFKTEDGRDVDNTLSIEDVKLKVVAKVSSNHYIGQVFIKADRTGGSMGSGEISQGFPIYLVTDSLSKVLYCYGNYASGGLMDMQQKQCEILLGADYFWNPKTNRCDNRFEVKCYPGSRFTASCPATTYGLDGSGCQAHGYTDPQSASILPYQRSYSSGAIKSASLPSAIECQRQDQFTVTCDYASDVDSSGATCSACCKVEKEEVQQATQNAG